MTKLFDRIRNTFTEFGIGAGLVYGLARILEISRAPLRIFYYELMVQPIGTNKVAPANLTKSFEVREIVDGDPILDQMPPPRAVIDNRFRQNCVCLGAFQKQVFVGYQWLSFGQYEEDEVRCFFSPQPSGEAVFDFDFYIFPEFRFGLGFVALWDATNEYLSRKGIKVTTSRVSRFNTASRKSHQHLGWRRVGRAIFLNSQNFQLMLASTPPYAHVSFGQSPGPVIPVGSGGS